MHCNIDAKGKAFRLVMGLVLIIASVVILLAAPGSNLITVLCMALLLAGAFAVFEGWAGWCALRAMGFKTRM